MRNGVLAITRDGALALMNDEGYRIFDLTPQPDDLGRPAADVLRERPEIVRLLANVFDLHVLPNRVEVRLRPSNRVIGYTLALVRSDASPQAPFADAFRIRRVDGHWWMAYQHGARYAALQGDNRAAACATPREAASHRAGMAFVSNR